MSRAAPNPLPAGELYRRGYPDQAFARCHLSGRLLASKDTGVNSTLFPAEPPLSVEQLLDVGVLPPEPDLLTPSQR